MSGEAISLVCDDDVSMLAGIERLIKRKLPRATLAPEDAAALDATVKSAGPDVDTRPPLPPRGRSGRGNARGSGNRSAADTARNAGNVHPPRGTGYDDGRMGRSDNRQSRDNNRQGFGRGTQQRTR
jgi:ATP-dependent RNA helicase RhlE